jgi:hypothetical protein
MKDRARRQYLRLPLFVMLSVASACSSPGPVPTSEHPSSLETPSSPIPSATPNSSPSASVELAICGLPDEASVPPGAILSSSEGGIPGHLGSYSWSAGGEGIDVSAVMSEVVPNAREMRVDPNEDLHVRVPEGCPITEWSVRAYDRSDLESPPRELTREDGAAGVETFDLVAPTQDAVIEAFLRFGSRGNAAYYWILVIDP